MVCKLQPVQRVSSGVMQWSYLSIADPHSYGRLLFVNATRFMSPDKHSDARSSA